MDRNVKNYDFVVTNKPVNSTAKKVLQKGEHCEIDKKFKSSESLLYTDIMPKCEKYKGPKKHNLSGKKYGNLTVIKYYKKGRNNAKWLCKCSCGMYIIRLAKSLKRGNSTECDKCNTIKDMRNKKHNVNKKFC